MLLHAQDLGRGFCLWVLLAAGCDREVYHGLRERQANQAIVLLREAGLSADKRPEGHGGGRSATYALVVPAGDELAALHLLGEQGLPRIAAEPPPRGGGLLSIPTDDRAQQTLAKEEHLADTLEGLPQVEEARVHLALSEDDPVRVGGQLRPTASVLLRLRGAPAFQTAEVQQLVARAVPGLDPPDVAVLTVQIGPPARQAPLFAKVGPLLVARESRQGVGALFAGFLLLAAALCAALAWPWLRRHPSWKAT